VCQCGLSVLQYGSVCQYGLSVVQYGSVCQIRVVGFAIRVGLPMRVDGFAIRVGANKGAKPSSSLPPLPPHLSTGPFVSAPFGFTGRLSVFLGLRFVNTGRSNTAAIWCKQRVQAIHRYSFLPPRFCLALHWGPIPFRCPPCFFALFCGPGFEFWPRVGPRRGVQAARLSRGGGLPQGGAKCPVPVWVRRTAGRRGGPAGGPAKGGPAPCLGLSGGSARRNTRAEACNARGRSSRVFYSAACRCFLLCFLLV
jgi:hypothetical protein